MPVALPVVLDFVPARKMGDLSIFTHLSIKLNREKNMYLNLFIFAYAFRFLLPPQGIQVLKNKAARSQLLIHHIWVLGLSGNASKADGTSSGGMAGPHTLCCRGRGHEIALVSRT